MLSGFQVFYMFEPLHVFGFKVEQAKMRMKALGSAMNCSMLGLSQLYEKAVGFSDMEVSTNLIHKKPEIGS